ncbi:hypothetical protein ANN_22317 [Periplaneta americana]|uniref:Uncharacterized protein n=1 Tax=Periplaneta americana TaxID=6978 RepID=A0ABQ8S7T8_PERAM|nr:hypothetical protein ANN_22317 [Periplaneta americana]
MRVLLFQIIALGIPLPPEPVLTSWGTWLDAVNYYAEHYGKIMEVIDALDSTNSSAVAAVKSLPSEQLLEDILFIDSNFKIVSKSIILLESLICADTEIKCGPNLASNPPECRQQASQDSPQVQDDSWILAPARKKEFDRVGWNKLMGILKKIAVHWKERRLKRIKVSIEEMSEGSEIRRGV